MKYFGTDGFRGEANEVLTVEHAFKVGRYLGWYYGQEHRARVVIGKDTRRSSYMFEYSLVAGLTASGADVCLVDKEHDVGSVLLVDDALESIGSDSGSNGCSVGKSICAYYTVGHFHSGKNVFLIALSYGEVEHEFALGHFGLVVEAYGNCGSTSVVI